MRALSFLIVALAAGCASPDRGWTRTQGADYPPTDPASVRVLDRKPDSAEVIGHVHAIHGDGTTALEEAKKRAAAIGAHAIVRLAKGDEIEMWPYQPWSTEFIEAEALRLR
jgi:hypothetical protein